MDIVHLRSNEASSGCVKNSLFEDNFLYEKKMGQELSAIATTHYCPSCSKTKEFDRKLGRYKRKFRLLKEDYVFDLSYKTDESGELHGYCKSCGFDMRNNNAASVNNNDDDITIIREYEVLDYAEQNNSYIIEFKSFMEFFNNKKKGTITDMIINKKLGEDNFKYRLDIDNLDVKNLKVNSNKYIEIPKKYWKS